MAAAAAAAEPDSPRAAQYYEQQCQAVGCRPNPALHSVLVQDSLNALTVLSLRETYIGDAGAFSLSQVLWLLPSLRVLDLTGNGLSNASARPLCAALSRLQQLRMIELSSNRLVTRKGGQELLHLMTLKEDLLWLGVEATMVSQYFACRLRAHGERRRARLCQQSRARWEYIIQLLRPRGRGEPCPVSAITSALRELSDTGARPPPPSAGSVSKRVSTPRGSDSGVEQPGDALQDSVAVALALTPRPPASCGTPAPPNSRHAASVRFGAAALPPRPDSLGKDSLSLSMDSRVSSPALLDDVKSPTAPMWRSADLRSLLKAERPMSSLSTSSGGGADSGPALSVAVVAVAAASACCRPADDAAGEAAVAAGPAVGIAPQPPPQRRSGSAPPRRSAPAPAAAGPPPHRAIQNEEHDEDWAPDDVEEASAAAVATASRRDDVVKVFSDSADFREAHASKNRGRFCITHDPQRGRVTFGFTTPTTYSHLLQSVPPQVGELFELIDAYTPKTVEIETPFKFPGRIDYVAAVGGPECFMSPSAPTKLPAVVSTEKRREAEPAGDQSMYWSFVTSSNTALAASRKVKPTERRASRNPNLNPTAALARLQAAIYHANIAPPTGYANVMGDKHKREDALSAREIIPDGLHRVCDSRGLGVHGGQYDHCAAARTIARKIRGSADDADEAGESPLLSVRVQGRVGEWKTAPEPGATWGTVESADGRVAAVYPGALAADLYKRRQQQQRIVRRGAEAPLLTVGDTVDFVLVSCARPPHEWQALDVHRIEAEVPIPAPRRRCSQLTFEERQLYRIEKYLQDKRVHVNTVLPLSRPAPAMSGGPVSPAPFHLHCVVRPTPVGLTTRSARLTSGALDFSGGLLATGSYDLTAKVWDGGTGQLMHTLRGHDGYVYDVIWNTPFCDRLVTASFDKTCKVWDAKTGQCVHTLVGHDLEVVCVAVNRQSTLIASGSMDEMVIVWNCLSGGQVAVLAGHTAEIVCVEFSPCGQKVVSGSADETIRVWSAFTGECLAVMMGHAGEVAAVKFNTHGNLLLSCSSDTTCRVWDVKTRKCKALKGHSKEVSDCEFSADGWLIASASEDMSARVWDTLTGGCTAMMIGHQAGVCCVSFCQAGKELLTGSADMTCRRWRVDTGVCLQVLTGHRGVVISSYCENGDVILTISKDNTCRVWRRAPQNNSLANYVSQYVITEPELKAEVLAAPDLPVRVRQRVQMIEAQDTAVQCSPPPSPPRRESVSDETEDCATGNTPQTPLSQHGLTSPEIATILGPGYGSDLFPSECEDADVDSQNSDSDSASAAYC